MDSERNKPDVIYIVSSNNIEELNIDDVKIERLDLKRISRFIYYISVK